MNSESLGNGARFWFTFGVHLSIIDQLLTIWIYFFEKIIIYININIYIFINICIDIFIHRYIYLYTYICVCVYIYTYIWEEQHIYSTYTQIYLCVCICVVRLTHTCQAPPPHYTATTRQSEFSLKYIHVSAETRPLISQELLWCCEEDFVGAMEFCERFGLRPYRIKVRVAKQN